MEKSTCPTQQTPMLCSILLISALPISRRTSSEGTAHLSRTPQPEQEIALPVATLSAATTRQVSDIRVIRQHLRNILLRLDATDLDQAISALRHRLRNDIRRLALALGADDVRLALLLRLLDNEARPFRLLLRDLLLFDGFGELPPERHVRDTHVFESNVELGGAKGQVGADAVRHGFALGDELGGVELGDDGFEHFVADGGEHALVVVLAEILSQISTRCICRAMCLFRLTW